jgi:hypothetical protein
MDENGPFIDGLPITNNQMVMDISPAQLSLFRQAASRLRCVGQAAKHSACSATRAAAPGATRRVQRRGIAVGLGDGCSPTLFNMFKYVS